MSKNNENISVPKYRFPNFRNTEEWQEKSLESIATFLKGKGISKSDISPNGKQPCIRYGELYTHYSEIIEEAVSYTDIPINDLILSQINDVIIPSSGETQEDIATASCVLQNDVALGGDLNILRSSVNGIFLAYNLSHIKKREIAKLAQGNAVVHLYANQLKKLRIHIPKNPIEQQKIAACLSSIDDLITAESQRLELLKEHKKGLLQNLFPQEGETAPKVRFKEFEGSGEWVVNILKEVATFINEKAQLENLSINSYISTENLLPDYAGVTLASKLPSSGNFTKYKIGDILISNIRPYLKKVWFVG
jgi:Restriction endonuclease S subunits